MDSIASLERKKRRPNFTPEFRKALAQRACEPDVSISRLAQDNDINVNMLFKWRRYLLAGKFDAVTPRQAMLPVTIIEAHPNILRTKAKQPRLTDRAAMPDTTTARQSIIEIQITDATMRFDQQADVAMVCAVVRMLRA